MFTLTPESQNHQTQQTMLDVSVCHEIIIIFVSSVHIIIVTITVWLGVWLDILLPQHIILCAVHGIAYATLQKRLLYHGNVLSCPMPFLPTGWRDWGLDVWSPPPPPPPVVRSAAPLAIQVIHWSRIWHFNGRFRLTSSGCSTEVRPPGITAAVVLYPFCSRAFTLGTRWLRNMSHTSIDFWFVIPPGLWAQTFCSHNKTPSVSIHPIWWTCTTTPEGNTSFGLVFRLKITMGFSLVPSTMHARTTVKCVFSWSVYGVVAAWMNRSVAGEIKEHGGFAHVCDVC